MATSTGDPEGTEEARRRARFDAFFDFYFPRIYTWLVLRTGHRASAERLSRRILEQALEHFEEGELLDHAACVLDLAEQVLAESGRGHAARSVPARRSRQREARSRR